jgi:hypothetical protein
VLNLTDSAKIETMTDEQLHKWNLRFCPKCGSHFHFKVLRSAVGQNQFSMVCNNYPNKCEYLKVLTTSNISDIDRHKIIEDYFGYNKPFQLTKESWEKTLLRYLYFNDTSEFIKWLFEQINTQTSLDHNNLPVASPYPHIVKGLSNFLYENYLDNFIDNLKVSYKQNGNYKLDSYLHIQSYQAKELIAFREIERAIPNLNLSTLFSQDNQIIKSAIEKFCSNIYSLETWKSYFKSVDREQLLLGVKKVTELYQTSRSSSEKVLIQALFSLCSKTKDEKLTELTDWILAVTDELDLPFGTTNYSAKTEQEYLKLLRSDNEIRNSLQIEQNNLETEKMNLRNNLISFEAQLGDINTKINEAKTHLAFKQKTNQRLAELKDFTGLSPIERLKKIINDNKPVFYFPEYFFNDTLDVLDELEEDEKTKLKSKLKTAGRGILKQLRNKITDNATNKVSD